MNKTKKHYIINYIKRWDNYGTVYNQGVNITEEELDKIQSAHLTERIMIDRKREVSGYDKVDYYYQLYLGSPNDCKRINSVVFTNHTQRDFFNRYLKIPNLKDRNTCFIIN